MADEVFKGQNYKKIRQNHIDLGVPWSDPTFPANEASIGVTKCRSLPGKIQWKRPLDLADKPKLFVDGLSSHDATQGELGNCWFVAACSVLAGSRPLWEKVIPDHADQEWGEDEHGEPDGNYSGCFRFRFWRFGKWVEVLVDDQLPTTDGKLIFSHSKAQSGEFWGALLEKAYAKLHGSYEVLDGGNLTDALVDFTGGVAELLHLDMDESEGGFRTADPDRKKDLFKTMTDELEEHSLMCCAISNDDAGQREQRTDLGLIKGHAYGITALRKVVLGGSVLASIFKGREKLYLVRLQNPWGEKEWNGPFGDNVSVSDFIYSCHYFTRLISRSPEWSSISDKERDKLGLTFDDDGEFWMPFDDFLHQFTQLSICRLLNTSLFSFSKTWKESEYFGHWKEGQSGGCLNNKDTFLDNPQLKFEVAKDDGDDVIIQLSQEDHRGQQRDLNTIGFHLIKVEENRKYKLHRIITNPDFKGTSDYVNTKHVFWRCKEMPKGRYVLIPTTFDKGHYGKFLLRIFADQDVKLKELTQDEPEPVWWQGCFAKRPRMVVRVTVKGASDLENQDTFGKSDPYCIIKCEGKSVKSKTVNNDLSPKWNLTGLFYPTNPDEAPVKIQVWNSNLIKDKFMGQTSLKVKPCGPTVHNRELFGKKDKEAEKMQGSISVEIEAYVDLTEI